jgi:hypothetical protein
MPWPGCTDGSLTNLHATVAEGASAAAVFTGDPPPTSD